jgi:hypothetical protein
VAQQQKPVIPSERGPGRFLQPGGGESRDLRLLFLNDLRLFFKKMICGRSVKKNLPLLLKGHSIPAVEQQPKLNKRDGCPTLAAPLFLRLGWDNPIS